MLILLPPSEGKAVHGDGPPVEPGSLSLPGLTEARMRVIDALGAACARPGAATLLGLPAGQADAAVARNRALRTASTLPAGRLYTGVLYENLDLAGLRSAGPPAAAVIDRLLIFSGLWGALRITDRVPPYRLAMNVALPPLGRLSTFWRPVLTDALRTDGRLVVDMRSAPYAAAWRPGGNTVAVRVFRENIADGTPKRTVISHMAKATRGAVAHDLLAADVSPSTPEELLKAVIDVGYPAELNGAHLDVIVPG